MLIDLPQARDKSINICSSRWSRAMPGGSGPLDRKSTRLNSSHGYISYAVLCTKKKNETRFQYLRENSNSVPVSTAPTISVPGAFIGGGATGGISTDYQDHYELQNYTSIAFGNH